MTKAYSENHKYLKGKKDNHKSIKKIVKEVPKPIEKPSPITEIMIKDKKYQIVDVPVKQPTIKQKIINFFKNLI